ncbi:MAG: hypothetical protein Tsb005_05150 [Gammaproteobacteria bacterium]
MNKLSYFYLNRRYQIFALAVFASVLLSWIVISQQQPINRDGILYLNAAKAFAQEGVHAAQTLYSWPFYSVIIASLATILPLSYLQSALVLNSLFIVLIILGFIQLTKQLGASERVQYIAGLIILLFPTLNKLRDSVIRDFGYWAFYLWGIERLIAFAKKPSLMNLAFWNISIITATLFRIEGAVFLLLMPFSLFLVTEYSWRQRIVLVIKLLLVPACLALLLALLYLISHPSAHALGRINELLSGLSIYGIDNWEILQNRAASLGYDVLNQYSIEHAKWVLVGGLIALFLVELCNALGVVYLLMYLYSYRYLSGIIKLEYTARLIIYFAIIINFLILFAFIFHNAFLNSRYLMGLVLLLLLKIPFALDKIFVKRSWLNYLVILGLCALLVKSVVHFGHSKTYLVKAGNWLEQHTEPQAKIFSNSDILVFYANRPDNQPEYDGSLAIESLTLDALSEYNYMAIRVTNEKMKQNLDLLEKKLNLQLVKSFKGDGVREVKIYKLYPRHKIQQNLNFQ